eukprot:gene3913-717_t
MVRFAKKILLLCLSIDWTASIPVNPRYFAFSSYLGPIVNLTFDDAAVLRVAKTLGIGSLRYPGGGTTSHWNYTSGRWVDTYTGVYADRTRAFPLGTFTPDKYMQGIGATLRVPPIWNLNLATVGPPYPANIQDPPAQIDTLRGMGVPVRYLELDNEKADEPLAPYLAAAGKAKISVIGCFGLADAKGCHAALKEQHSTGLFDAVTIHHYGPNNSTVSKGQTDLDRRSATLAPTLGFLAQQEATISTSVSPKASLWLDEFNWGGPWAGMMWPEETHGGLRGLSWASYVLSAIHVTAAAQAAGRSGYDAVMSYSLFYQACPCKALPGLLPSESSDWSKWASCAHVPDQAGQLDQVAFDGVAQVFAHFSRVALSSGYSEVEPLPALSAAVVPATVPGAAGAPCVLAARFSSPGTSSGPAASSRASGHETSQGAAIVMLNVCPSVVPVNMSMIGTGTSYTTTVYSGRDKGGWVLADEIVSLDSPPWQHGPLTPAVTDGFPNTLAAVSLSLVDITNYNHQTISPNQ